MLGAVDRGRAVVDGRAMNIRIHHVALVCKQIERMEAFYCRHLGFRRVRTVKPGQPDRFVTLRLGDFCVELFAGGLETCEPAAGMKHLCFEVDSVDAWYERLKGVAEFSSAPRDSVLSPWLRLAFFKDPDGNTIEIQHGWKDTE